MSLSFSFLSSSTFLREASFSCSIYRKWNEEGLNTSQSLSPTKYLLSCNVQVLLSGVKNAMFKGILSVQGSFRTPIVAFYKHISPKFYTLSVYLRLCQTDLLLCLYLPGFLDPPTHRQQPQIHDHPAVDADVLPKLTSGRRLTCLCLISSFFCSRKAEGMPAMFSWALNSRGHRSFMNSRAFFPFRKPVRLICIILLSGCCNTHTKEGEKRPYGH